jgi:hypothetical protein
MKKCTVEFILNSSHDVDTIGFYSCSEYKILDKEEIHHKYISEILISDDISDEVLKEKFEKEAKIASVALAKNERNPSDSCPYFRIDWKTVKIKSNKPDIEFLDDIQINDHLAIKIIRNIELKEIQELLDYKDNYSFEIDLFYHGLMSNNAKSKFFHFFTIIEIREKSNEYKALRMINLNRVEKLFQYLKSLNLECINSEVINIEDIKSIINQRNALYHASRNFDNNIVYDKLFPLVRELVIKRLKNE